MFTILWFVLLSNNIINLPLEGTLIVLLTFGFIVADCKLIEAICERLRK